MNRTECKILRKALDEIESLNEREQEFIQYLTDLAPSAPLSSRNREKLYAIGHQFDMDGRKMFAREVMAKHKAMNKQSKSGA